MVITDLDFVPVLNKIAKSSASLKFCAPLKSSFSLGLSSRGKSFTL